MELFETELIEYQSVKIRIEAKSKTDAERIRKAFIKDAGEEYLSEELDLNGEKCWMWTKFKKVNPDKYDECATISENKDGSFDAGYKGGYEND